MTSETQKPYSLLELKARGEVMKINSWSVGICCNGQNNYEWESPRGEIFYSNLSDVPIQEAVENAELNNECPQI